MKPPIAAAVLALVVLAAAAARAAPAPPPPPDDRVVVQAPPSPALWRVTRGAGELWILPAPPALPRGLRWSPLRLQGVLKGATVLITPAGYALDHRARAPRAGAPAPELAARLPASVRDRFGAAVAALGQPAARYARLSPLNAAYRLRDDALDRAGLDPDQPDAAVRRLARAAGVRIAPAASYRVDLGVGEAQLSDAQAAGCVDAAVDDADWARDHADQSARAWALGDVRAWLAQARPAGVARCLDADRAFAALHARVLADSVRAAQAALAKGGRAVMLTSPDLLLRAGGLLDRLRAAGDEVTPPAADR